MLAVSSLLARVVVLFLNEGLGGGGGLFDLILVEFIRGFGTGVF